jgi:hydrogenase expression/formation protein HypC
MCVAVPGKVIEIRGSRGTVDILGNTVEADLSLLRDPAPGEYVIVHAGFAIQRLDERAAQETLELFREIAEVSGGDPAGG